ELGNGRYCYPLAATNLRPPGAFKLDNGVLATFCQPCLRDGHRSDRICLERAKGFEPSTPTLARLCSTPELHPHPREVRTAAAASQSYAKERRAWQPPPPPPMKNPTGAADGPPPPRTFLLSWTSM